MRNIINDWLSAVGDTTLARKLSRALDRLWVRIVAIGLLSFIAILVARLVEPLIPDGVTEMVGANAADELLTIIANSMLAVTIFSLTVMVSVYRAASSQWTPRVHRLMLDDSVTQNTLATLLGAYLYSLTSIILLNTTLFADDQVVVMFFFTVLILGLIVVTIVRWIVHLRTLGSLIEVTRRIEAQATTAFRNRMEKPCLGGRALRSEDDIPDAAHAIEARETGYVQHIYEERLSELAEDEEMEIYLTVPVGHFAYKGDKIAFVTRSNDHIEEVVLNHMAIGDLRTFEQDARFGLIVLGEIGSKALSPGINDPGTAIDVVGRMSRIFDGYANEMDGPREDLPHPRLFVPPLSPADLIEDGFDPIARDGGGLVEVQIALQSALAHLAGHPDEALATAAKKAARRAFERAEKRMEYGHDLERLRDKTPVDVTSAT